MDKANGSIQHPLSFVRGLRNIALFLVAFGVVTCFLVPPQSLDVVLRAKLDYFKQHKDEFGIVFLGTSRVYRCFDARLFDQEIAGYGHRLRSFNFGLPYHRAHEIDVFVDELLAMQPQRLKHVAIELMSWDPTILEKIATHDRTIHWHTPSQTISACRTIWLVDAPLAKKIEWWSTHLSNFCAKYTNHGGATRWISLANEHPGEYQWRKRMIERHSGFIALDDERDPAYAGRRQYFRNAFVPMDGRGEVRLYELFLEQVAEIPEENAVLGTLERFNLTAQLHQQTKIKRQGIKPIYVLPNVRFGTPDLNELRDRDLLEDVLTYNHPQQYPAIYIRDNYWDRGHLNKQGAAEFTRLFAKDMAKLME